MDDPGVDVVIFRSPVAAACNERALVLRAMNIEHAVGRQAGEWFLTVPVHRVPAAVGQLEQYARESRGWPRRHAPLPHYPLGLTGVLGCVFVLLAVAAADGNLTFGYDWFNAGRIDTDLVRQGEWWRTVTALTLHLDVEHLVGNLVVGSIFGLVAGRLLGEGLAWLSIVLAGAVGNGMSAAVQLSGHSAVGASTAVFAALGLIAAYVWRRRAEMPMRWGARWAPMIVAAVLLAWTGSGDGRTDVVAHLSGFVAGSGLGVYYGSVVPVTGFGPRVQWLLGLGAVAVVGISWAIALGAHG